MSSNMNNINYNDFKNICRMCMFNCDVKFYQNCVVSNIFHKLTDLHFETNDHLPQQICRNCFEKAHEIHEFAIKCKRTHSALMDCLKKQQDVGQNENIAKRYELQMILDRNVTNDKHTTEFVDCDSLNSTVIQKEIKQEIIDELNDDTIQETCEIKKEVGSTDLQETSYNLEEKMSVEEHKVEFIKVEHFIDETSEIDNDQSINCLEDDLLISSTSNINVENEEISNDDAILNEIREEAQNALPQKSKDTYMKVYTIFKNWCALKNVTEISENVLLEYFQELSHNKKASTLWATFSMLKSTFLINENTDISKYFKLIKFLKGQNVSYTPKQSCVFSKEEVVKFLVDAPDEAFLSTKAIFVIGLAGACRTNELCNMLMKDVDVRDDIIIVNIPKSKYGPARKFVLVEPLWLEVAKKYLRMRPNPDMVRVFIGFRNGKPTRQNIGHNKIGKVPKIIAEFLKLPNPDNYSGYSVRRTSAILTLKQHGEVEDYAEETITNKKRIAGILKNAPTPSTSSCFNSSPDIPLT